MATSTAFSKGLLRGSVFFAALVVGFSAYAFSADEGRVTIDATKLGEPIAPLVYGQFIEHLGRCIYGGLWAEMLEDRKFFYPVTGEAPPWEMFTPGKVSWEGEGHPYEFLVRSPWLVLGENKKAVSMVKERPYVGEHSPRVTLPGGGKPAGLVQERLGLETTKTAAEMEPTGQVLALYRKEFGSLPATVTGVAAPLDVAAAFTADRSALTVAVVNPTAERRLVPFDVRGAQLSGPARRFVPTGRDRWAWNAPGQPRGVTVEATSLAGAGAGLEAPPLSVALYRFALR